VPLSWSILLSSIILALVVLFGLTRDSWRWDTIARRAGLGLAAAILIAATAGSGIFVWKHLPTSVAKQTEYAGLRIGMKSGEVKYIKGYPPIVLDHPALIPGPSDTDTFSIVLKTTELDKGKRVEDYPGWEYVYDDSSIEIEFDPKTPSVVDITCISSKRVGRGVCPELAGIRDGDSEKTVLRTLGEADDSNILDLSNTKHLYYNRIGVHFSLAKEVVYSLGINDTRYVEKH
jgi:hypothetical protein